jgi:MoxR-like ATPase
VTDYLDAFKTQICEVIVGKNQAVKLAVACLLSRGHLLIEDIPGVGKTTLSQALARSLALAFQRIQFTSDLLPADILGNSIFDRMSCPNRFSSSRRRIRNIRSVPFRCPNLSSIGF